MSLHAPTVSFNGVANLKPELIGLAAWLCCQEYSSYSRLKILTHAAVHGSLDGMRGGAYLDDDEDFELACQALAAGQRGGGRDVTPAPIIKQSHPQRPYPEFRTNGTMAPAPIAGGAPVDAAGVNGQEDPSATPY